MAFDHYTDSKSVQSADPSASPSGRLEPEIWEGVELPLPYPSVFDRPVAPSKLDPVLLRAKLRGEAVYADERGLL